VRRRGVLSRRGNCKCAAAAAAAAFFKNCGGGGGGGGGGGFFQKLGGGGLRQRKVNRSRFYLAKLSVEKKWQLGVVSDAHMIPYFCLFSGGEVRCVRSARVQLPRARAAAKTLQKWRAAQRIRQHTLVQKSRFPHIPALNYCSSTRDLHPPSPNPAHP
jgi:hypothetical protein